MTSCKKCPHITRSQHIRTRVEHGYLGSNVKVLVLLTLIGNANKQILKSTATHKNLTKFGRNPVHITHQSMKASKQILNKEVL